MNAPTDNIRVRLGQKVRQLREARGWSQEDLAARAFLHRNQIGYIEQGQRNISIETIARLAAAFDVPPGELFR
ncbi:helix-turn-helix transcriptional regulator [Deinococcus sonorensis]|uniref:Helix-turn-helix transcriptional regulator n=2 Tax=Deinococcus sonorensis TaxID=309891 RepID=A0AAU7U5Q9_9DEIO